MKDQKHLPIIVISILLIAMFTPFAVDSDTHNKNGGTADTLNDIIRVNSFDDDYIAISTPYDLAKIGKTGYPLNGKYYLTNDIDFTDVDTNGVKDINISIMVSGDELTIDLDAVATTLYVWFGNIYSDDGTTNFTDIPNGEFVLSIAGILDSGELFAYSTKIDTSKNGTTTDVFKCNGNFDPIGTMDSPFTGTFDGNGYNIIGLDVTVFRESAVYAGLFGYTSGATISNLGMIDSSILAISTNYVYAGGIIGYATSTTISNTYNTGDVTATSTSATYVGGTIGYATSSSTTITNCYNTGDVTATLRSESSNAYAGGIVGQATPATISNSYNTGTITASTSGLSATYVGGMVGNSSSSTTITNCYNTGTINASSKSSNTYAGGTIGYASSSSISNTYNTGTINASSASLTRAGGIIGYASSSSISNTYNTGTINASSSESNVSAGGIVGYASILSISNSYNTGTINATSTSTSASNVSAGGIVGNISATTSITNCYFLSGKMSANGTSVNNLVGSGSATIDGNDGRTSQASGYREADELRKQSTYYTDDTNGTAGWDFDDVWLISDNVNNGYPILRPLLVIVFTEQPEDTIANSLEGTATFTSSASVMYAAETQSDLVQYQWYISEDQGADWTEISGATGASYTLNSVTGNDSGTLYRLSVTASGYVDTPVSSQIVILYVTHTITLDVTGNAGSFSYSTDGGNNFINVSGNTITVDHGADLIVEANESDDHGFVWDDYNGKSFTVTESKTLKGTFTYTVTVFGAGTDGYYTYSIGGSTPEDVPSDGKITGIAHGSELTVTPVVISSGLKFAWSDGETGAMEITVTSSRTLTGFFVSNLYTITVEGAGTGGSYAYTVNGSDPSDVHNGVINNVPEGSHVVIIPVLSEGHSFVWDDGTVGNKIVDNVMSDMEFSGTFTSISILSDVTEEDEGSSNLFIYSVVFVLVTIVVFVIFLRTQMK